MSLLGRRGVAVLALGMLLSGLSPAALAVTADEIVKTVEKARIISPELKLQAAVNGTEADLSTYRNPKATDNDCKIDAVLIAKEVMEKFSSITRVKVLFYDATNRTKYREVMIRQGDVEAFRARKLTQDQLLSSIEVINGELRNPVGALSGKSYGEIAGSPPIVDGPYKGERIQLWGRIESLKSRGVGVAAFVEVFLRMEDQARKNNTEEVAKAVEFLSDKLAQQDRASQMIRQQAAAPRPVHRPPSGAQGAAGLLRDVVGASPGADTPRVHAARQELGMLLAPVEGDLWTARYQIARRIRDMENEGRNVDSYLSNYRELQEMAARGIPAQHRVMVFKARTLMISLGLPTISLAGDR